MGLFDRKVITKRDDAALPHEDVPLGTLDPRLQAPEQHAYDDGVDGDSTPNGGR